jgi:hypothetical protein
MGVPKWLAGWLDGSFHGKSEHKTDDDWRYPHDLGNLQIMMLGLNTE